MDHSNFKNYKAPAKKQALPPIAQAARLPEQPQPRTDSQTQQNPATTAGIEYKNRPRRTKTLVVGSLIVCSLAAIGLIGISALRGLAGKDSSNNPATVQQSAELPQGVVETAGFSVYGIKDGSAYSLDKADNFDTVPNSNVIVAIANSTVPGDTSQLTISQQPISEDFETKTDGLPKLLKTSGSTSPINAQEGKAFLVKGSQSVIVTKPGTLITVQSSKPLGTNEWQQLVDALIPLE